MCPPVQSSSLVQGPPDCAMMFALMLQKDEEVRSKLMASSELLIVHEAKLDASYLPPRSPCKLGKGCIGARQ